MSSGVRVRASHMRAALRLAGPLLVSPRVPISVQRRLTDLGGGLPLPAGTNVVSTSLGGIAAERVTARGAWTDAALLYLHGGGYNIGSLRSHRGLVARLAARAGAPAFVLDYRLAPEHPHPAALDDTLAAYRDLLDQGIAPERIAVAGDSAGAGLALALAMRLRDSGLPAPAVLGLVCPWVDLTVDLAGRRPAAPREPLITPATLASWGRAYVAGHDPADPAISPGLGDLSGLPPLVLRYAGDDVLRPDAELLARRAQEAGAELDERCHDGLWHDFQLQAGLLAESDAAVAELGDALRARLDGGRRSVRTAIVGAGMSGLCMAHKLREAGVDDFAVYEKAEEVGGTWRENRYPGLTCDVPSHFYSYSFAPNPGWTRAFAPGPEIHDYFTGVADDLGLRPFIRFGSEVTSARWEDGRWHLRTGDGREDDVDVLVSATGVLHHPRVPEIEGLETFEGAAFHSARWDHSVALEGKRIGVVGTGSTGVQIVTDLAGRAGRLVVFQRTAQWVLPVPNPSNPRLLRRVLTRLPGLTRLLYRVNQTSLEAILGRAAVQPGWQRSLISGLCRLNLRLGVRDPDRRRALTPDYDPMCKRLVMSAGFYSAMGRRDVELVTEAIDHVEPRGVVTRDGVLHEVDVLVLATGFDPQAFMRPMELIGEGGLTIDEAWADGPHAYRTVAVPGFPNFFTLIGPHSPIGNQSLIMVAETQSDYVVRWIEELRAGRVASTSPTPEATASFNEEMRRALPGTVWMTGCNSWYLGADGLPALWPWTPARHRKMLDEPVLEDFATEPAAPAALR